MSPLLALAAHDVRLQYRYGIYAAYAFVLAFYIALLAGAGSMLPAWVPAVIVFSDPAALGFFFLGALMMLEKSENVRAALAVTPLTPAGYIAGKMITLTGLALLASFVIGFFQKAGTNQPLLLLTVALTSVQYVGIGVPVALHFRTVTGYIMGSALFLTPIIAPGALAFLDPMPAWLAVIPAVSQLRLMLVATGAVTADATMLVVMLAISAIAAAGAFWLAAVTLGKEFGR